ncbi:hypothetical protein Tco_0271874 [Tanacetum coccineum]
MGTSSGVSSFTKSSIFSSGKAQDFGLPSKSIKQGQATASPAEGEKNTNPMDAEPNLHDEIVDLLGIDVMTQEDGTSEDISNVKVSDLHLAEWREIDFNKPLKEQDPLNERNDLAKKRKRTSNSTDHSRSTKKHKSSVQHEEEVLRRLGSIFTSVYAAVQKLKKAFDNKFEGYITPIVIQPPCYSASKIQENPKESYLIAVKRIFRDHILKGDIELHFIPTQYQLVDIFTKPLDEPTFKRLIVELAESSSHNPSSPEITPKEELVTLDKPESTNPYLPTDHIEFTFEEIAFTTNNEVVLLYPPHPNSEYFREVSDFISKCCLKEVFIRPGRGGFNTTLSHSPVNPLLSYKTLDDSKI